MLDPVQIEWPPTRPCEQIGESLVEVLELDIVVGKILRRLPEVQVDHRVDRVRVVHRPHGSVLNLPEVRQKKRDAADLWAALLGPARFDVVIPNPANIAV